MAARKVRVLISGLGHKRGQDGLHDVERREEDAQGDEIHRLSAHHAEAEQTGREGDYAAR